MEIKKNKPIRIENRRYLGSKARLLDFIHKVVREHCGQITSVADIFAGTGNVAWSFNNKHTKVMVNDLLESNYISYLAWFGNQGVDSKKISRIIDFYNEPKSIDENYFSTNFSDTYFSHDNCLKIGFVRDDIEKKYNSKEINERERAILITSLLYAMDHIANTVGHYDAYRMNGNLNKPLVLETLALPDQGINDNNEVYREDANELVRKKKVDLVYIDPPYNSRQYCDAYHLLENVADWTKPEVFGIARKMRRDKSVKSGYCMQKAPVFFDDLIQNISAKYILVSYNNMGTKGTGRSQAKISDDDIVSSLSKRGKVQVFSTDFNQFSAGKTHIDNHQERLFLCTVGVFSDKQDDKDGIETPAESGFAKSPLNYTGGKFRLLSQLGEKFDKKPNCFVDLFGGGFNVGVNMPQTTEIYCDKQEQVGRVIKLIYKTDYHSLVSEIEEIIHKYGLSETYKNGYGFYACESNSGVGAYNKPRYEKLRADYNGMAKSRKRDVYLLTLIFYAFNNQIRFNSKGEYNMPVGKRDFNSSSRKNLKDFSVAIKKKKITFYSNDFEKLGKEMTPDCFVYCDPPYLLGEAAYNENDGWTESDESRLLEFLTRLNSKGVHFALSNFVEHHGKKHEQLVRWINDNRFNTTYIKSKYSNSNYHIRNKAEPSIEVLVTNY